jgi:hypothetical protein
LELVQFRASSNTQYVFVSGIPLARAQGGSAAPSGDAKRQSGEAAHNEFRQAELCSLTSPAERPIHLSRCVSQSRHQDAPSIRREAIHFFLKCRPTKA